MKIKKTAHAHVHPVTHPPARARAARTHARTHAHSMFFYEDVNGIIWYIPITEAISWSHLRIPAMQHHPHSFRQMTSVCVCVCVGGGCIAQLFNPADVCRRLRPLLASPKANPSGRSRWISRRGFFQCQRVLDSARSG